MAGGQGRTVEQIHADGYEAAAGLWWCVVVMVIVELLLTW